MCCGLKFFWFSENKNRYLKKSHTVEEIEKIIDNEESEQESKFGCLFLIKVKTKKPDVEKEILIDYDEKDLLNYDKKF